MLFRDREQPLGAFQTGGLIGNMVACGILFYLNGRALYLFHEAGGLRGVKKGLKEPLIVAEDELAKEKKPETA